MGKKEEKFGRKCDKCGADIVVNTGQLLKSHPPQYKFYCKTKDCKNDGLITEEQWELVKIAYNE